MAGTWVVMAELVPIKTGLLLFDQFLTARMCAHIWAYRHYQRRYDAELRSRCEALTLKQARQWLVEARYNLSGVDNKKPIASAGLLYKFTIKDEAKRRIVPITIPTLDLSQGLNNQSETRWDGSDMAQENITLSRIWKWTRTLLTSLPTLGYS